MSRWCRARYGEQDEQRSRSFNGTRTTARLAYHVPVTVDHEYDHGMSEFDLNVGLYRRDSWYRYLIRNERVLEN